MIGQVNRGSADLTVEERYVIKYDSDSGWYLHVSVLFALLPPSVKINSQHCHSKDKYKVFNASISLFQM